MKSSRFGVCLIVLSKMLLVRCRSVELGKDLDTKHETNGPPHDRAASHVLQTRFALTVGSNVIMHP